MWALAVAFLRRQAAAIAVYAGAAVLVLAAVFSIRNAGRQAERLDNLKKTLKVKDAQQIAASRSPHDRSELLDELHNGRF